MVESGAWLSVADAALALGVSPDTIRRKRKSGELTARPEPTAYGFRWLINLDGLAAAREPLAQPHAVPAEAPAYPSAQAHAPTADPPMTEREQKLWDALQREQQASAELRILLQRALERQPMLELPAPADTAAVRSEAPPSTEKRRRWWSWLVWS